MSIVNQNPPTHPTNALIAHVEHFQNRVIQDALIDATAEYWSRRALAFEAARPRPEDYVGESTPADLKAADERCLKTADACRLRAQSSLVRSAA